MLDLCAKVNLPHIYISPADVTENNTTADHIRAIMVFRGTIYIWCHLSPLSPFQPEAFTDNRNNLGLERELKATPHYKYKSF